jgi:NADH-quinone oxidoreductase subunit J
VITFFSVAGVYVVLHAEFLAAVQILVYAGGIMVLFLFVIMLVNLDESAKVEQFNKQWLAGVLAALGLGGLFAVVYYRGHALFPGTPLKLAEGNNTQLIGVGLYQNYLLPFEIASVLLLVAIIGAVVMAKKRI